MESKNLDHPPLIALLRKAYSAERAASFAYIGHAGSLKDPEEKAHVKQIELDEWNHRDEVLKILQTYKIPVSRWYEWKFYAIGKFIGLSCYVIGRFMPYFFAGKLESGNVCEYFVMMQYFQSLGIHDHDEALYEMGVKEKEHEIHFQKSIENEPWLPLFEKIFGWGKDKALNDVDLDALLKVDESASYCASRRTLTTLPVKDDAEGNIDPEN